MPPFKVIFYETADGSCPIQAFLDTLDLKMRAKTLGLLKILVEYGYQLREPYSKPIRNGIFELRCQFGNNISRILYFFYDGQKIILTNGFIKKTTKTPSQQIELAEKYRLDYLNRSAKEERT